MTLARTDVAMIEKRSSREIGALVKPEVSMLEIPFAVEGLQSGLS